MRSNLEKLWRGEQPLGRAFWLYFLAGWIGLLFLAMIVHVALFSIGLRPIGLFIFAAAYLAYPVFAGIGVWKSANVYEYHGFYPIAAKAGVCFMLAPMAWSLMNGGALHLVQLLVSS